jgi:tetratricopeptide (TPR) repeat protein
MSAMTMLKRSFATMLVLSLVAAAGGGCTKAARVKRAVERADHYYQAGDYSTAEAAYGNACRMAYPPDPVALRQLGLVYAKEGRPGPAFALLLKAATNEPGNAEIQVELASILPMVGRFADAEEAARQALKLLPGNEKALVALCDAVRSTEDAGQTRRYIEQLQKQDQDRACYHLAFGLLDARVTNLAAAENELNMARSMDPKSSLVYAGLARLSEIHTNLPAADEAYKTAVQLAPLRSPVRMMYAEFQARTGATNQARKSMMELVSQAPDYFPPLLFLMKLAYGEGNYEECESCLSRVLAREPNNYDALLMKADVSMAKKDGNQAVADFEYLMAQYPKDPRPQLPYQLAMACLLSGNRTKARSNLDRSLELDTNFFPAKITLAEMNMRQGNSAAAISLLAPLMARTNLPPAVLVPAGLILAQSYLLQKSPDQAVAICRRMEQAFPKEAQIPFLEGQAWVTADKLVEARAAFEKSFAVNSDYAPALEELVILDLFETRYAAALERVKKQMDKNPKAPLPWLLQAEIHVKQKENALAQADLEKVIEIDPKLPLPYHMLAKLFLEQNQTKQALDKLNALVALTNSVSALMEIGVIHGQLKEYDLERKAYEKLLSVDPHSVGALNNLACLYSEHFNDLDQAYRSAQKARELAPYDPFVADTLGWILYKKQDYTRALALLQESAEKQPNDGEVQYHVGMAHYRIGEEESARLSLNSALSKKNFGATNEALRRLKILDIAPQSATSADRAELEKQLEQDSTDPIALIRMAAMQERDGDFEKAAVTYEKAIKQTPQNARAIIRLALLNSTKLGQAQKGLDLAKNAHTFAPDDPYISETLGRMLFQAHDYPYALNLLQAAARLLPTQPDLLHDLAWACFSMGQVAEAQDAMQRALQTNIPFDKLNDARQFLDMMSAFNNPAQPQATARVQQVLETNTNYAPALMALGREQEHLGRAKEAERAYEKVLAAYPLFLPAIRQLAILYAQDGDNDSNAYSYAVKAGSAFPGDEALAKVIGMVEYRRKDYANSLRSLDQGARKKGDDAELFWYLGMDYYELKQPAEAKKALKQALDLKLPAKLDGEARRVLGLLPQ